jgi:hypothetical protein
MLDSTGLLPIDLPLEARLVVVLAGKLNKGESYRPYPIKADVKTG